MYFFIAILHCELRSYYSPHRTSPGPNKPRLTPSDHKVITVR